MSRSLFALLFLAPACHVRPESLVPESALEPSARTSEYLTGRGGSFVVLGDASTFVWPALLQQLLDAHARRPGLYHVLNAAAEDGDIASWTPALKNQAQKSSSFQALLSDYLSAHARLLDGAPAPRVALCLVSLRGLGDADGPVKSANDMLGAEMGADALERLARALHERGVEHVVFGTPLYAPSEGPELGLEHVAIERLLARGLDFVQAGPDLFSASRRFFPDAYEADGLHPNEFGMKLMAEEWYRWLAAPEAHEEVVEALYAQDFDVQAIESAYVHQRGALQP